MIGKLYRSGAIALVVGALSASNAIGALVHRDFDIIFDTGALAGSSFPGSLSYDDTNIFGSGFEYLGPTGGFAALEGALSFDVTIGPDTFRLEDDSFYPDFPSFQFFDGELIDVGYLAELPTTPLTAYLDLLGGSVLYITRNDEESEGRWVLRDRSVPDAGVGLFAFGVCVVGLMFTGRRNS